MTGRVLVTCLVDEVLPDALSRLGYTIDRIENVTRQYALQHIGDYTGIITSTRLALDRELLQLAVKLKWIGRMGSGMEIIDTGYATAHGIHCISSPDGNCNSVGEHALGMLLTLTRNIVSGHQEMVNGIWQRERNRGVELEGRTIGIIGFGHTGRSFARKLSGFQMRILAYDKYATDSFTANIQWCNSLQYLYDEAEIISFHVPLQHDTIHYLNDDFISRMKRPFIVINTSRGSVVDFAALHRGILSGKINGACLDVFEEEPPFEVGSRTATILKDISRMSQVVLTPHIAGYSHEAIRKMSVSLANQIGRL